MVILAEGVWGSPQRQVLMFYFFYLSVGYVGMFNL